MPSLLNPVPAQKNARKWVDNELEFYATDILYQDYFPENFYSTVAFTNKAISFLQEFENEDDPLNLILEYVLLFIGLTCAFIGSLVACRFANQKEYIVAAVLSIVGVWWGYEYEGKNVTIMMHYISLCVLVLLVFLPAYLNKRKNA